MFACVPVSDDGRAGFVDPLVAVGMIEVPVRVDEVLDGIRAYGIECVADLLSRGCESRVDEELAIAAGKNCDVAACAEKSADISSKLLKRYLGGNAFFSGVFDEAAFLGPQTIRKKPCGRNHKASRRNKMPTRDVYRRFGDHIWLLQLFSIAVLLEEVRQVRLNG